MTRLRGNHHFTGSDGRGTQALCGGWIFSASVTGAHLLICSLICGWCSAHNSAIRMARERATGCCLCRRPVVTEEQLDALRSASADADGAIPELNRPMLEAAVKLMFTYRRPV